MGCGGLELYKEELLTHLLLGLAAGQNKTLPSIRDWTSLQDPNHAHVLCPARANFKAIPHPPPGLASYFELFVTCNEEQKTSRYPEKFPAGLRPATHHWCIDCVLSTVTQPADHTELIISGDFLSYSWVPAQKNTRHNAVSACLYPQKHGIWQQQGAQPVLASCKA